MKSSSLLRRSLSYSCLHPQFTHMIFLDSQSFIHHFTGLYGTKIMNSWLVSPVGRALHRYRAHHGFKSRTGLTFFRSYFQYCSSSVHYIFIFDNFLSLIVFVWEKRFKVQDLSFKSCIMFFTCHLELESGNNICNSIFKKIYFGNIISPSATPRSGEGIPVTALWIFLL